jgi:hypothetical protein
VSLADKHSKQKNDRQGGGSCGFQLAGCLQTAQISKDDQDPYCDSAQYQQRRAEQGPREPKQGRHGEGANSYVLVRPFTLKAHK